MPPKQPLGERILSQALEPLPAFVSADQKLSVALGKMRDHRLHEIAVLDEKKRLLGVVSEETLLRRKRLSLQALARNLMVVPPRITAIDPLSKAARAFIETGFREIPVLEPERDIVAGQVTRWGLLKIMDTDREIRSLSADALMTPNPLVVRERDPIDKALELMRRLDEPTVPVVDVDGRLTGVVSASDILRVYAGRTSPRRVPHGSPRRVDRARLTVEGLMSSPAVDALRGRSVGEVMDAMLEAKVSSLVISEGGKPVGIVTKSDLIELLASQEPQEGVFIQVTGLDGHDPYMLDEVFGVIEPAMQKLATHVKPLVFNLHVMEHHRQQGHRVETRARFSTDRGVYFATGEDDNILRATDEVLTRLSKQVQRDKDRSRTSARNVRA